MNIVKTVYSMDFSRPQAEAMLTLLMTEGIWFACEPVQTIPGTFAVGVKEEDKEAFHRVRVILAP